MTHALVNFRLGQEFQGKDLQEMQDFLQTSIAFAGNDGLGPGAYYAGLTTLKLTATTVKIAAGHYWQAGKVYNRFLNTALGDLAEVVDLADYLPILNKRVVALVVWGREIETDSQERDFLVDFVAGTTEQRAVPMLARRDAVVEVVAGEEATAPGLAVIPPGTLHFCTAWLTPSGIERVEMVTANQLPRASDLWLELALLNAWRLRISAQLETLRIQIAALAATLPDMAKSQEIIAMMVDVARIKQFYELPDTYASYGFDNFIDASETDPAQAGYSARIDNGLLFPTEAIANTALALLSPLDAGAALEGNLLLPAYEDIPRLSTTGYTGQDMAMAVEQQTYTYKKIQFNQWVNVNGWSFNQYAAWWVAKFAQYGQTDYRVNKISLESYAYWWNSDWNRYWKLEPVEVEVLDGVTSTTITGAIVAQTFIAPAMWLTGVDLYFTQIDTVGDVTVLVCPVSDTGRPLMDQVYESATLPYVNLKTYPNATHFDLKPVYLDGGGRYAICVMSTGTHRLAVLNGKQFTEGDLFTATSGDFFVGDLSRDLLFTLYSAKFRAARNVISLQPTSLAGGINDLKATVRKRVPAGCNLELQYQLNGTWYSLDDDGYPLEAAPNLLPLRVVFLGTLDVQPGLTLTNNAIEVSRSKTSFTHWATLRTLTGNSTSITVKVHTHRYVGGTHTLTCSLVSADGATTYTAGVTTIADDPDGSKWHTFEFTITAPGISSYRVKLAGTRPNASVEPFTISERLDIAL